VALLKTDPTAEVTAHAAAALRNLARGNAQNRDAMREAGAIAPLVALLGAGPKNEATSHACAALANLTFDNVLNQDAVRDAGGVRPLMALLGTSSDLTTYATGALANGACSRMHRFRFESDALARTVANPLVALSGVLQHACLPVASMLCPPRATAVEEPAAPAAPAAP